MAHLHLIREHGLGLQAARKIAYQWAEQVESEFDMQCVYEEGDKSDTVRFSRSGVKGNLEVTAKHFELNATLGLLLGAFKNRIEAEIIKNLDDLLHRKAAKPVQVVKHVKKKADK